PTSVKNLSPINLAEDRWVWVNQVEKVAGDTDTFMMSNTSFHVDFKSESKFIVLSTKYTVLS
ncbi:MAG: hypothetical protein UU16_C0038G0012, partial [Candidatus Woesebacteria bacterium GW2011_GWA2_40_7]